MYYEIHHYEILRRFMLNHKDLVEDMKKTDHNYSPEATNPYHLEGDVWTHTMMVFNHAVRNNYPLEVLFSALLHDVGKPAASYRNDEKQRVRFTGHDGISFYKTIDILNKTYSDVLTAEQKETIAKLVACHSVLFAWKNDTEIDGDKEKYVKTVFAGQSDFLSLLCKQNDCDVNGRIGTPEVEGAQTENFLKYQDFVTYQEPKIEDERPTLTLLVGPPGSGKSTWVKENVLDEVVISSDDLIMQYAPGETYNDKWNNPNFDFNKYQQMALKLFDSAVKDEKDIVIDRTNMNRGSKRGLGKGRRRFVRAARYAGYNIKAVVFMVGEEELMKRIAARSGKTISTKVMKQMMQNFNFPLMEEADEVVLYNGK